MATYPGAIVAFATHNTGDTVQAADVNTPNAEIVAVETGLLNGFQHNITPSADLGQTLGTNALRWAFPAGVVGAPSINFGDTGTGFYRNAAQNVSLAIAGVQQFFWNGAAGFGNNLQPRAIAKNSALQTISTATFTALTFDTDETNVGSMHSTSANTSRMTVQTGADGFYFVIAFVSWAGNATGQRQMFLRKNGATTFCADVQAGSAAFNVGQVTITCVQMAATDYMEVVVYQDSGGNLNTGTDHRFIAIRLF